MEKYHNEDNNLEPHKITLSDIEVQETKVVLLLLKHIIDSHPNDYDLGKQIRSIFNNLVV